MILPYNLFRTLVLEAGILSAPDVKFHVTLIRHLPAIKAQGLKLAAKRTFSNYANYSARRIFLTDKEGVEFWKERVEAHEFDQYDDPKGVVVLAINVDGLNLQPDPEGSRDSRHPAYFVTTDIPKERILHYEEFPEPAYD